MEEARGRGSEEQNRGGNEMGERHSGAGRVAGSGGNACFQINNILDVLYQNKFGGLRWKQDEQDLPKENRC